jgi:hypothetical protein
VVGYEYWNGEERHGDFLSPDRQRELIQKGCQTFSKIVRIAPSLGVRARLPS